MDFANLAAPFAPDAIHWRAQTLTRDKSKAMALAYLDARDVMDRLDEVCSPTGWQSEFTETAKGRVICRIGIRCGDEWVWKADGAGDTDVEGEKGALSDALKRAAVSWGVGRYLYRIKSPWVPCEVNDAGRWKAWKDDPWKYVRGAPPAPPAEPPFNAKAAADKIADDLNAAKTADELAHAWKASGQVIIRLKAEAPQAFALIEAAKDARKAVLSGDPGMQAPEGHEYA